MGRPRLSVAEKLRRGTLEPARERRRGIEAPRRRSSPEPVTEPRDYVDIYEQYMHDDVRTGRMVTCEDTRLAIERQVADLKRQTDPAWPYRWSAERAIEACEFIEKLPHVEGDWDTPTIRLEPAQVFEVCTFVGWRQAVDDAVRRFTVKYKETGRKSAKTTIDVGLSLYHVLRENESGAQVIFGATTGQQSRIAFSIAQRMVRRSAWLRDQGLQVFANAITYDPMGASLRPVNAKATTLDGLNPSCIVLDESHAQTFALHDVLKSAQGSRRNPMLLCPTTAGYDLLSVGYALRSTLQKVLRGVVTADHLFGIIYSLEDGDDWRDPVMWPKANPLLGVTPKLEWMQRYCADAQATPGMAGEFQTKCCSLWLHSAGSWLSMAAWDKCADRNLTLDAFVGERAYVGVDLAERDDIAAVAIVFKRDDVVYAFVTGYLPELVVAERARAVPEYRAWVQSGELITTPGNMTDYAQIEAGIRGLCDTFDVQAIVIERYGALNVAGNLSNDGLPARVESKNAKVFTSPCKDLEARVKAGQFRHTGSSFLKWQASNVAVERRRDGSLLPVKADGATSPNKIDGIDSILLGLSAMLEATEPQTYEPNIYLLGETRI